MAYIIMSDSFRRLCEITKHKSILWHELYLDPTGGDFQLQLAADKYLPFVKKGYYIINTESEKFGIIDTYEVTDTEDDGLVLTVSGLMGESILQRRVIWPTISMRGTVDDVVATIIRRNVTEPGNQSRQIANFQYVSNAAYSRRVSKQITGATVADAIVSIVGQYGWGYIVSINDTQDGFTMRLIDGTDRSVQQTENPVILFSAEDFGLTEFTYLTSEKAVFSHVICAGEGQGLSRTAVIYPSYSNANNKGLNRREVFLDKKDLSRDAGENGTLSEESYLEKLEYEAQEKLKESATSEACEGIIRPYRYRLYRDFIPGDIVSVRNERLGMEYDIRVLGALISIDENGSKDITAEMGDLIVSEIEDEPEEDVIEEEEPEEVVDVANVWLSDAVIDATLDGGNLTECDSAGAAWKTIGKPSLILHIFDNNHIEIVLTANARYYKVGSEAPTIGSLSFDLTPEQNEIIGDELRNELEGMIVPVQLVTGGSITHGYVTINAVGVADIEGEDGKVTGKRITANTACSFGDEAGPFALISSFSRVIPTAKTLPPGLANVTMTVTVDRQYAPGNYVLDGSSMRGLGLGIGDSRYNAAHPNYVGVQSIVLTCDGHELKEGTDYTLDEGNNVTMVVTYSELCDRYGTPSDSRFDLALTGTYQNLAYGWVDVGDDLEYNLYAIVGMYQVAGSATRVTTINEVADLSATKQTLLIATYEGGNLVAIPETDYTLAMPNRGTGSAKITFNDTSYKGKKLCVYYNAGKNLML